AAAAYERLGMPFERYFARELSCRILQRTAPGSSSLEELTKQSEQLLKDVVEGQRGDDKVLVQLNKWSTVEKATSLGCQVLQSSLERAGSGWLARRWRR